MERTNIIKDEPQKKVAICFANIEKNKVEDIMKAINVMSVERKARVMSGQKVPSKGKRDICIIADDDDGLKKEIKGLQEVYKSRKEGGLDTKAINDMIELTEEMLEKI